MSNIHYIHDSLTSESKNITINYRGQEDIAEFEKLFKESRNYGLEQKYLINDTITTDRVYKELCNSLYGVKSLRFGIKKVIFNNPATIIIWNDGTKTISKISQNDIYSKEYGFMLCVLKHILGPKTKRFIKHYCAENTSNIMKGGEAK